MSMKLKPIESAPKDGTSILAYDGAYFYVAYADIEDEELYWFYFDSRVCIPTHWCELPEVPNG